MRDPFHPLYACAAVKHAEQVGRAVSVLSKSRKYANAPLAAGVQLVYSALALRQCRIHADADGRPGALIIWGWLSAHTMRSAPRPAYALPMNEWNEGERLCIVEVLGARSDMGPVINDFLNRIAPHEMTIYTYPSFRTPQAVHFTRWKRSERAALVAALEAQC